MLILIFELKVFVIFFNIFYILIKFKVEFCRNWNVFWDFLGMFGLYIE